MYVLQTQHWYWSSVGRSSFNTVSSMLGKDSRICFLDCNSRFTRISIGAVSLLLACNEKREPSSGFYRGIVEGGSN